MAEEIKNIMKLKTHIVGMRHQNVKPNQIPEIVKNHIHLKHEPNNKFDQNAVECFSANQKIGYIEKEKSKFVKSILEKSDDYLIIVNSFDDYKISIDIVFSHEKDGLEFKGIRGGDKAGIYEIEFMRGGYWYSYIGQSVLIDDRIRQHLRELSNVQHKNEFMQWAWLDNKETFKYNVLYNCPENLSSFEKQFHLFEKEIYYIENSKHTAANIIAADLVLTVEARQELEALFEYIKEYISGHRRKLIEEKLIIGQKFIDLGIIQEHKGWGLRVTASNILTWINKKRHGFLDFIPYINRDHPSFEKLKVELQEIQNEIFRIDSDKKFLKDFFFNIKNKNKYQTIEFEYIKNLDNIIKKYKNIINFSPGFHGKQEFTCPSCAAKSNIPYGRAGRATCPRCGITALVDARGKVRGEASLGDQLDQSKGSDASTAINKVDYKGAAKQAATPKEEDQKQPERTAETQRQDSTPPPPSHSLYEENIAAQLRWFKETVEVFERRKANGRTLNQYEQGVINQYQKMLKEADAKVHPSRDFNAVTAQDRIALKGAAERYARIKEENRQQSKTIPQSRQPESKPPANTHASSKAERTQPLSVLKENSGAYKRKKGLVKGILDYVKQKEEKRKSHKIIDETEKQQTPPAVQPYSPSEEQIAAQHAWLRENAEIFERKKAKGRALSDYEQHVIKKYRLTVSEKGNLRNNQKIERNQHQSTERPEPSVTTIEEQKLTRREWLRENAEVFERRKAEGRILNDYEQGLIDQHRALLKEETTKAHISSKAEKNSPEELSDSKNTPPPKRETGQAKETRKSKSEKQQIAVIGLGGCGCNSVEYFSTTDMKGADWLSVDKWFEDQATARGLTRITIRPDAPNTDSLNRLAEFMSARKHVIFIVGLGGNFGTLMVQQIANALESASGTTVHLIATLPFAFEGAERLRSAENALSRCKSLFAEVLVLKNQELFALANKDTTFAEAFRLSDDKIARYIEGLK